MLHTFSNSSNEWLPLDKIPKAGASKQYKPRHSALFTCSFKKQTAVPSFLGQPWMLGLCPAWCLRRVPEPGLVLSWKKWSQIGWFLQTFPQCQAVSCCLWWEDTAQCCLTLYKCCYDLYSSGRSQQAILPGSTSWTKRKIASFTCYRCYYTKSSWRN